MGLFIPLFNSFNPLKWSQNTNPHFVGRPCTFLSPDIPAVHWLVGCWSSPQQLECSVLDGSGSGRLSRKSLSSKRKSWIASSVRGTSSGAEVDIQDLPVKTNEEDQRQGGQNEARQKPRAAGKTRQVQLAREAKIEKPKPSSVRRRPQSAPNKKVLKAEPPPPVADLGEYSKSLKLVGVDVPSNRTEATKIKNQEIQVKTKEPTFKTRILRRSGSYADLTKKINQGMKKSDFQSVKSELNKAIFENWYFNKFQQGKVQSHRFLHNCFDK